MFKKTEHKIWSMKRETSISSFKNIEDTISFKQIKHTYKLFTIIKPAPLDEKTIIQF